MRLPEAERSCRHPHVESTSAGSRTTFEAMSHQRSIVPMGPERCFSMMSSRRFCDRLEISQPVGLGIGIRTALALQVIGLPIDKQHRIGVLLDRSRLPQVGKLWPLIIAGFNTPIELRER